MKKIVIISVAEACRILKEHGMSVVPAHIHDGIESGAYPFGVCIPKKRMVYEIYLNLLMKWIDEHSIEVDETTEQEEWK